MVRDVGGNLRRDPALRVELLEKLCDSVQYAYPMRHSLKDPQRTVYRYEVEAAGKVSAGQDKDKVAAKEAAKHVSELPTHIVRGTEKNHELFEHCQRLLGDYDDYLADLMKSAPREALSGKFCVETAKSCSRTQLADIEKAGRPPEPEMPVGMRPEDWPHYKKMMYNDDGTPKEETIQRVSTKKKKKRKRRE